LSVVCRYSGYPSFSDSRAVTVRLTVGQSVSLGVEPNLGPLTRDIFFLKLQSCLIWGALSDERSGLSFVNIVCSSLSIYIYNLHFVFHLRCAVMSLAVAGSGSG
jgi:hypothetical protein